jgi:hypothetical protein
MIKSFEQFLNEALSLKSSDRGEHFLERVERRLAGLKVVGMRIEKLNSIVELDKETTREIENFFRKTLTALADPKKSALFKETTIDPTKIGLVLMARPQVILPDGRIARPVFSVYERTSNNKQVDREGSYFWIVTIGSDVQTILLHPGDGRKPGQLDAIVDRSINHLVYSREAELARLSRLSGIDFTLKSEIKSAHQVVTDTIGGRYLTLDLYGIENPRKQADDKVKEFTETRAAEPTDFESGGFYIRLDSSKQMTVSPRTWFMEKNEKFGAWGALPVLKSSLVKGVTGNEIWLEVGDKWVYWLEKEDGTKIPPMFNAPRPSQQRIIKKGDTVSLAKEIANGSYVINTGIVSEIAMDSTKSKYPYFKTEDWTSTEVIDAVQATNIFRRKEPVIENLALTFKEWTNFTL